MSTNEITLDAAGEERVTRAVAELAAQAAIVEVRRAARRLEKAQRNFEETLRVASAKAAQRRIAAACGLSLASVNRIIHGGQRA